MEKEWKPDSEKLVDFVNDVKIVLADIVNHMGMLSPVTEKEEVVHKRVETAWKQVEPRFSEIVDYLRGQKLLQPDSGTDPMDLLNEELRLRGLTGDELDLKLFIFHSYKDEHEREWQDFLNAEPERRWLKRRHIRWWIRRLLKIINALLRSLGLIPGIDSVAEVKDIVEDVIDPES